MPFQNLSIEPGELPAIALVELQPVQRVYKKILRIEWSITTGVLIIIASCLLAFIPSLRSASGWPLLIGGLVVCCGLYYFFQEKNFSVLAFAIRDKDVLHRKGWLFRSLKICPFNRIQNCSVLSGPIERSYGLASLIIYTAGSDGADMKISGLLQEEAERLRYFILEKIHAEKDEHI